MQIGIGRSDDPHVHLDDLRSPDPPDLFIFQDPQEFSLERERHLAQLIQENGAPVGRLEKPDLPRSGPGEGAALIAEELAFQKVFRQGRAVDLQKRPRRPGADGRKTIPLPGELSYLREYFDIFPTRVPLDLFSLLPFRRPL